VAWQTVARPEGATWIDLALRTGVTADSLWRRNDMPAQVPDPVYVPTGSVQAEQHTVAAGETLYSLAGQYGVSVRALQAANDLDATDLSIGQTLRIPSQQPMLTTAWAPPDTAQVAAFPSAFAGRLTASGAHYDPETLVGSHPTLPYHSVVLISYPVDAPVQDARHVFVRIIDRSVNGPEVSTAAAEALELQSTDRAALRVVWHAPK
jgi:LysM repeat protein